jgi:ferredoxin
MDRRRFFKDGVKDVAREVLKSPVGKALDRQLQAVSNLLAPQVFEMPAAEPAPEPARRRLSRPPGALSPAKFEKKCTRCADCIVACPYGVLFQMGPTSGPLMDPNLNACRLCPDTPCIDACETGALLPLKKNENPQFGLAVINDRLCRNHQSRLPQNRPVPKSSLCKICVRECPVDGAISLDPTIPAVTDACTGCGKCVHACPTQAILVSVFEAGKKPRLKKPPARGAKKGGKRPARRAPRAPAGKKRGPAGKARSRR